MPTLVIQDTKGGLDARNMRETTLPGSLLEADNCVINEGGELQKLKSWERIFRLPAGTFGLKQIRDVTHVFGSDPEPGGIPQKVQYNRLQKGSLNMINILSVDLFDGLMYVVAQYDDGTIVHFYDGNEVTGWVDGRASAVFEITGGTSGSITSVTVDGVETLSGSVAFNTDLITTASDVAANINGNTSSPNYIAVPDGPRVIVRADLPGTAANGRTLAVNASTLTTNVIQPTFAGGIDNPGGVFQPGTYVKTINEKMYALSESLLHFSNIDKPTEWDPNTGVGAGFINLSNHSAGSEQLLAIAEYVDRYAIFSNQNIQIWSLDPDEELNVKNETLKQVGTLAPRSVVPFGNDTAFLDRSGIRSLRARDSSRSANVSDIGTAIDPLIRDLILEKANSVPNAQGITDPLTGRYFLSIDDEIFIFSLFPGNKVSAWTVSKVDFVVEYFDQRDLSVIARSGDNIYQLGGPLNDAYDDRQVNARFPYIDAGDPSRDKKIIGLDVACEGEWDVYIAEDTRDETKERKVATIIDSTFKKPKIAIQGISTHISLRFVSRGNGPAKIGRVLIHFDQGPQG